MQTYHYGVLENSRIVHMVQSSMYLLDVFLPAMIQISSIYFSPLDNLMETSLRPLLYLTVKFVIPSDTYVCKLIDKCVVPQVT